MTGYARSSVMWRKGHLHQQTFLGEAEVTILSERREMAPWRLEGGEDGKPRRHILKRDGREEILPSKVHLNLSKGDRLRIETPGGRNFSNPPDIIIPTNSLLGKP